jgi:hypothetical protein
VRRPDEIRQLRKELQKGFRPGGRSETDQRLKTPQKSEPGDRSSPSPEIRLATSAEQAREEFDRELNRSTATKQDLVKAFLKSKTFSPDLAILAAKTAIAKALKSGEVSRRPLDPSAPFLSIPYPSDERLGGLVDQLLDPVNELLKGRIKKGDIRLVPFLYGSSDKRIMESIPRSKIIDDTLIDRLAAWDGYSDDNRLRSLRGKAVLWAGHIVGDGLQQAFERQHDNGQTSRFPISQLDKAAKYFGFRYVPLGCETRQSSAIGTVSPINSLDVLNAVRQALESDPSTFGELLAAISGPNVPIDLDPSRLEITRPLRSRSDEDKTGRLPITFHKDGQVYVEVYARVCIPRAAAGTDIYCPAALYRASPLNGSSLRGRSSW